MYDDDDRRETPPEQTPAPPPFQEDPPQPPPYGGPAPREPKFNYSGNTADFHKSFWLTLLVSLLLPVQSIYGFMGNFWLGSSLESIAMAWPVLVLIVAVVLRIKLEKRNHYLAKGFLWGAVLAIAVPLILFLLLMGSCLLLFSGF